MTKHSFCHVLVILVSLSPFVSLSCTLALSFLGLFFIVHLGPSLSHTVAVSSQVFSLSEGSFLMDGGSVALAVGGLIVGWLLREQAAHKPEAIPTLLRRQELGRGLDPECHYGCDCCTRCLGISGQFSRVGGKQRVGLAAEGKSKGMYGATRPADSRIVWRMPGGTWLTWMMARYHESITSS